MSELAGYRPSTLRGLHTRTQYTTIPRKVDGTVVTVGAKKPLLDCTSNNSLFGYCSYTPGYTSRTWLQCCGCTDTSAMAIVPYAWLREADLQLRGCTTEHQPSMTR